MCIRDRLPIEGKKTVCLISGRNVDVNILSRVISCSSRAKPSPSVDVYKRQANILP